MTFPGSFSFARTARVMALAVAPVLVMALALGACGSDSGTEPVENPSPSVSGISPSSAAAGSEGFTLTVNGTGFIQGSTVRWNGTSRTTTFVSSTRLTASIPATDLATEGEPQVTVSTPAPGGGVSGALTFQVTPQPVASLSVEPGQATLLPEQTVDLVATPRAADGAPLERTVTWASGNGAVATIDADGQVVAVASGSTTITAASEGQTAEAEITVLRGVGPAGGMVASDDGRATLHFPVGAVAAPTAITIEANAAPPSHPGLVPETAWSLGPAGGALAEPVTVRLRYDPDDLAGSTDPQDLAVHRWDGSAWQPLADGSVDASGASVSGTTTTLGVVAVLHLPPGPPAPAGFQAMGNGGSHACGVLTDGRGFCWGENDDGQLGNGSTSDAFAPVAVSGGHAFASITPGYDHTCGLTPTGEVLCWGAGRLGQIGNGVFGMRTTPTPVTGGRTFSQISAGYDHVCGLDMAGAAFCWGIGEDGTQGNGTTANRNAPGPVSGEHVFTALSSGGYHTCGLKAGGEAWCWGWGSDGQTGAGGREAALTPVPVAGGRAFTALSAGGYHTCGLDAAGDAFCWGWGRWGQLGRDVSRALVPEAVAGGMTFSAIAAGGRHTCGLTSSGEAWCWGSGEDGTLGTGTPGQSETFQPQRVAGGHRFASLSAGDRHTCGVTLDAEGYCWGRRNGNGDGTGNHANAPVRVSVPVDAFRGEGPP